MKVLDLVTTPESYPVWFSLNPVVVPRRQQFSYSYCIKEGGVVRSFENDGEGSVVSFVEMEKIPLNPNLYIIF